MIKPPSLSVSQVAGIAPTGPAELVRRDAGRVVIAIQSGTRPTELVVGEMVTARLVEPLHNQQWAAVIKGGLFTLHLPGGATVVDSAPDGATAPPWTLAKGGTLSLQVATLEPRLTFVLADPAPSTTSSGAVALQLSAAAQMLSQLIHASERSVHRGDPATPAHLPVLLSNPAAPAAERAQALAQAISHSGLFYESHLLAWAEGRLPQGSLGTEPQARIADALKDASPALRDAATAELGSVLQRQLDVLDGKPLAFAGFAWPGQPAEWRIQREIHPSDDDADADESSRENPEHPPAWTTQLNLELPHLGALAAQVRVTGSTVQLTMTLGEGTSAGLVNVHRGRLESALQGVGLTLSTVTVNP